MLAEVKNMVNDLAGILTQIKQSIDIGIAIFTLSGEEICSTENFALPGKFKDTPSGDIVSDPENDITVFPLKRHSTKYIGLIGGSDEISRRYAVLISALINNVFTQTKQSYTRAEKFKMLLSGELEETQVNALKTEYLNKPFNYYVLTVVTDSSHKQSELKNFLEAISERDDVVIPFDDKSVAFIKKCGTDDEYQSANDFAYTLYDNIKEEIRINIVINVGGTTHSFDDLITYFHQCTFAYSFGKLLTPSAKIYSYKEYIMIKMLSDIPKSTLVQYMDTLLDKNSIEIISDDELMNTAEEFLKNSLNISETSRSMYMHRNTLIYRLDKIENATGLNLRHFNDAVIFRLITILNKLTNSKN